METPNGNAKWKRQVASTKLAPSNFGWAGPWRMGREKEVVASEAGSSGIQKVKV